MNRSVGKRNEVEMTIICKKKKAVFGEGMEGRDNLFPLLSHPTPHVHTVHKYPFFFTRVESSGGLEASKGGESKK